MDGSGFTEAAPDEVQRTGRAMAAIMLSIEFDRQGMAGALRLLEDARQRLAVALAARVDISATNDICRLARHLNTARGAGNIGHAVDDVRTEFGRMRREAMLKDGWIA